MGASSKQHYDSHTTWQSECFATCTFVIDNYFFSNAKTLQCKTFLYYATSVSQQERTILKLDKDICKKIGLVRHWIEWN